MGVGDSELSICLQSSSLNLTKPLRAAWLQSQTVVSNIHLIPTMSTTDYIIPQKMKYNYERFRIYKSCFLFVPNSHVVIYGQGLKPRGLSALCFRLSVWFFRFLRGGTTETRKRVPSIFLRPLVWYHLGSLIVRESRFLRDIHLGPPLGTWSWRTLNLGLWFVGFRTVDRYCLYISWTRVVV